MKKLLCGLLAGTLLPFGAAQADETVESNQNPNVLIAYYSWSGNTKEIAEDIHKAVGGTLFEIQTVQSYPEEYRATTEQAKKEINDHFKPELKTKVENMAQYDTVFIGSPNWWGTIAPAVSSFLAEYDLNGKTVIPFITHGGGGEQNTVKDLTAQCTGCHVSSHPWVSYKTMTLGRMNGWLKEIGFIKE